MRVTHGNLLANELAIQRAFGQSEASVVVGWLPLYHDMGLIGNVLAAALVRRHLRADVAALLPSAAAALAGGDRPLPGHHQRRPRLRLLPSASRKIPPAEREGLDLSSWRVAFNGAEPVRAETLDAFADAFAPCGFRREAFYPCYGLAEATLFVSGGDPDVPPSVRFEETGKRLVSCGRRLAGRADRGRGSRRPAASCRRGEEGEIWVPGPSVADGYWNGLRKPRASSAPGSSL